MQKTITPAERLIVAVDIKPPSEDQWLEDDPHDSGVSVIRRSKIKYVERKFIKLVHSLQRTGVCIKMNSALRACGYNLINEVKMRELKVFADLKLFDIGETLSTDGVLLKEAAPDLLTVSCLAGIDALKALKNELPNTEVLGVTVLTSLKEQEVYKMFRSSIDVAAAILTDLGEEAGLDGFICSPKEVAMLRSKISASRTLNTPGIRPTWAIVSGDDQNPERIMTPAKSIQAGADRIVVGRPITGAENPYDAVMRTIDEIAQAMEK